MGIINFKKENSKVSAKAGTKSKALVVKAKPEVAVKAKGVRVIKLPTSRDVIIRPRITEKASFLSTSNIYAFEIGAKATKSEVAKAVFLMYKVTPAKVRILRNPAKVKLARGIRGEIQGVKKAYVYLKKGDKIEII